MKKITQVTILILLAHSSFAQSMDRTALKNYTITNIYENPDHAITGTALQSALLNYDYSCLNFADTNNIIPTYYYLATHTPSAGIPFSDTNGLIATYNYVATHAAGVDTAIYPSKGGVSNYQLGRTAVVLLYKGTVNLNTTADQIITLSGGNTFIITDIVMTNASEDINTAHIAYLYSGPSRTGNEISTTGYSPDGDALYLLNIPSNYINVTTNFSYFFENNNNGIIDGILLANNRTVNSPIYFSLYAAQGSAATCDMYIYGYILN